MECKCKKCNKGFIPIPGKLRNFCSLSCRNSRNHTEETKKKIQEGRKESNYVKEKKYLQINWSKINSDPLRVEKFRENYLIKIKNTPWENLSLHLKKRLIVIEQNNVCLFCGLNEWLNKPLVLEIDHINGDHGNESRSNLRCLCPNCHSQTDTWRGKKLKKNI